MNRYELKTILLDLLNKYKSLKTIGYLRSAKGSALFECLVNTTNYMKIADISERVYHVINDLYKKTKM